MDDRDSGPVPQRAGSGSPPVPAPTGAHGWPDDDLTSPALARADLRDVGPHRAHTARHRTAQLVGA